MPDYKSFCICFLFLVLLSLVFPVDSFATSSAGICERSENTADMLACEKSRHEKAVKDLKKAFDDMVAQGRKNASDEKTLWDIQKNWLSYRDQECARQSGSVPTQSLSRIQELKCLAALTERRTNTLQEALEQETQARHDANAILPRWMNVIARERQDIFWRYGSRMSVDTDCDGDKEEIMIGLTAFNSDEDKSQNEDLQTVPTLQTILAIAENPPTGKPMIKFIAFEAEPAEEEDVIAQNTDPEQTDIMPASLEVDTLSDPLFTSCLGRVGVSVSEKPPPDDDAAEDDDNASSGACHITLNVYDHACALSDVSWTGQEYEIQPVRNNTDNDV